MTEKTIKIGKVQMVANGVLLVLGFIISGLIIGTDTIELLQQALLVTIACSAYGITLWNLWGEKE